MSARATWTAVTGVAAIAVALGAVGACAQLDTAPWPQSSAPAPVAGAPYDRDHFGGWIDADGDRCDTRDEVLARDALGATVDPDGCVDHVVIVDPYTGERVDGRSEIDIDHRVSLHDAWDSGAHAWTDEQREAFANDESNLIATSDDVNRAKSDQGPDEWRPPARSGWCDYATGYRATKTAYGLAITPSQNTALAELAASCPGGIR